MRNLLQKLFYKTSNYFTFSHTENVIFNAFVTIL